VIWIGLKEYDQLNNLGLNLLNQLDQAGFPQDRQNFVPHLTIGRIKHIIDKGHFQKNIDKFKKTFFQEVEVREITLMESILKPGGPQYFPIEKYILG
jgi:2'-5' RNA ligase